MVKKGDVVVEDGVDIELIVCNVNIDCATIDVISRDGRMGATIPFREFRRNWKVVSSSNVLICVDRE